MAKGIVATIDKITEIVRDITPTYDADHPFTCVEDGSGKVVDIEHDLCPERYFDVRHADLPADAGYTGPNGFTLRSRLLLRIRYRTDVDRGRLERKIGTDIALVTQAILDCCLWDSANTGINTIVPPQLGAISGLPIDDQPAVLVSWPIEVEYQEGV